MTEPTNLKSPAQSNAESTGPPTQANKDRLIDAVLLVLAFIVLLGMTAQSQNPCDDSCDAYCNCNRNCNPSGQEQCFPYCPPWASAEPNGITVVVGQKVCFEGLGGDLDQACSCAETPCGAGGEFGVPDKIIFGWSGPSGGQFQVDPDNCANAFFIPEQPGQHTASLTVTDLGCTYGDGIPATDTAEITAICFDDSWLSLDDVFLCPKKQTIARLPVCEEPCDAEEDENEDVEPHEDDLEPNITWSYEPVRGDATVEILDGPDGKTCTRRIVAGEHSGVVWIVATIGTCRARKLLTIGCSECSIGSCRAGSGEAKNGSVDIQLSLGSDSEGDRLGFLHIFADEPTAELTTPAGLRLNAGGDEFKDYYVSGVLAQVKVPQTLAVVTPVASTYEVRFYTPNQVTDWSSGSGPWTVQSGAQPFKKWIVSDPTGNVNLRLEEFSYINSSWVADGVYDYEYTLHTADTDWEWSLSRGPSTSNIVRIDTKRHQWSAAQQEWTLTTTVEQDGGVVSEVIETYDELSWGRAITSRSVATGGTPLVTTFEYFPSNAGQGEAERLWKVSHADGSWEAYRYNTDGFISTEIHSWKDDTLPTTPVSGDGRSTSYTYWSPTSQDQDSNDIGVYADRPRIVTERIGSTVVAKSYHAYYLASNNLVHVAKRCADPSASYSTSTNLTTKTTYKLLDEHRPLTIEFPDGRKDSYYYPGLPTYKTVTITHGTLNAPDGIANKTTQETLFRDTQGNVYEEDHKICTGSSNYSLYRHVVRTYDAQGRVLTDDQGDGAQTGLTYDSCCGDRNVIEASGIVMQYEFNELLGRPETQTRVGVGSESSITTSFTFDVDQDGLHVETTTVSNTLNGEILETVRKFDLAGRLVESIDEDGLSTIYDYDDSWIDGTGRRVIVTQPNGATQITEYYRDGRVKSVTGTAVVSQHHDYGVDGNARTWSKTAIGSSISSPRYTTTTYDALGRTYTEVRPAYSSGTLTTSYEYYGSTGAGAGQVKKVTPPGQAATLYVYDEMGNVSRTALDVNGNSSVDLNGMDRVNDTDIAFENTGGYWWRTTTSKIYPTNNNSAAKTTGIQRERLSGFSFDEDDFIPTRVVQAVDIRNNTTQSTTEIKRSTAEARNTTDFADAQNAVSLSTNGMLRSTTSKTGAALTYTYDHFGRRKRTTGPRAEVWTQTNYATDSNRIASVETSDADGGSGSYTTTYVYYDDAQNDGANFGRIKSITNPLSKTTYFSYSARGEMEKSWGHVPQPTWVEYDAYGQRIALHTYRNTSTNWTTGTWPSGAGDGDETNWTYHEATGLMTTKTYADATSVGYTYTSDGKLYTRTWARNSGGSGVTTYSYSSTTGELTGIDYPSGTTDITFTYLRSGQLDTVVDDAGTRTFTYTSDLEPWQEKLGTFYTSTTRWITHTYASTSPGRLTKLEVGTSSTANADYQADYTYDSDPSSGTSRMTRVTGPGLPSSGTTPGISYRYVTGSNLVEYLVLRNNSANKLWTHRAFENGRDLLDKTENYFGDVDNQGGSAEISTYNYTNDDLGRRTVCNHTGSAFTTFDQQFDYNDRNELTYSKRPISSPAKQWTYVYDPIGNRTQSVENLGSGNKTTDYERNNVNQYPSSELSSPHTSQGYRFDDDGNLTEMFVAGDLNCSGSVTSADTTIMNGIVNNQGSDYGRTWYAANVSGCQYLNGDFNGDGNVTSADQTILADILTGGSGASATLMNYTYDAENRLIKVEPPNPGGAGIFLKTEFKYDYMGCRIEKKVWQWASGSWGSPITHAKYVWDGWLLLEELNGLSSNAVTKKYTWGLDLAGLNGFVNDRTSAGGIGGLLGIRIVSGSKDYSYLYDGNGNVGQLVEWSLTSSYVKAKYEYDPYGNRVNTGSGEPANDFRFSTKMLDSETGLHYYGYRYYSTKLGRWISRDPIGERAGSNVSAFASNAPTLYFDAFGLDDSLLKETITPALTGLFQWPIGSAIGRAYFRCCGCCMMAKVYGHVARDREFTTFRHIQLFSTPGWVVQEELLQDMLAWVGDTYTLDGAIKDSAADSAIDAMKKQKCNPIVTTGLKSVDRLAKFAEPARIGFESIQNFFRDPVPPQTYLLITYSQKFGKFVGPEYVNRVAFITAPIGVDDSYCDAGDGRAVLTFDTPAEYDDDYISLMKQLFQSHDYSDWLKGGPHRAAVRCECIPQVP